MNNKSILEKISGLTADSRMVRKGWLFAALPGVRADGRDFIKDAVNNGAIIILAPAGTVLPEGVDAVLITDIDARRRFSLLAAGFYKNQPQTIVAVTGTNGKTSTVTFAAQLWDALGLVSASLGTLGVISRVTMKKGGLTTPDPVALQGELADLAGAGITHLAMEASSIGVDQRRLDGVKLAAAAFTNLTHDHLDYHGTMDGYFEAKARLFTTQLPENAPAVIYIDDAYGAKLASMLDGKRPLIRIGKNAPEMRIESQTPTAFGQLIKVFANGKRHVFALPLVGLFQGINALTAAALVMATEHVSFSELMPYLQRLAGVPGRLQLVPGHPKKAAVYVDYAHTPHGLETVLKALRPHTAGKLVVVFGCGGDRDKGKRIVMGHIAARLADVAIVTDDNPRSEAPAAIRAEIIAGAPEAQEIGDRRAAIRAGVAMLNEGDMLVIAGKGHELGQTIGDTVFPFDDVTEAGAAFKELSRAV